jgi:predicted hotdog family 3-hydroxylacyl-ACP dehydratase
LQADLEEQNQEKGLSVTELDLSIEDLLPHRGRMLLLGEVLQADKALAVSRQTVSGRWPLCDGEGVDPIVLIELVAQTAGICNGLDRVATHGAEADRKGWLVGVKKAILEIDHLPLGAEIVVTAKNHFVFDSFREIGGTAHLGDRQIAEVVLQVVRAEEGEP